MPDKVITPQTTVVDKPAKRKPAVAKVLRTHVRGWIGEGPRVKLMKLLNDKLGNPDGTEYHRSEQPTFIFFRTDPAITINHASGTILSGRPKYEWSESGEPGILLGTEIDYDDKGPKTNPNLDDD
jgi:hypothetical protein